MSTSKTSAMGAASVLRRRGVGITAAAAACVVLTACGTTVRAVAPSASGQALGAPGGLGVTGTAPGGDQGVSTVAPLNKTGPASSATTADGGTSPASSRASELGAKTAKSPAKGVPYKVGVPISTSANAALLALGAKGSVGDMKAEAQAVIAWVNAHGGVGGRPIDPVWWDENMARTPEELASDGCVTWTQDNHVDAALPGGPTADMDGLRQCLGKARIPAVSIQWHVQSHQQDLASSPLWVEPLTLSLEAYARTYVDNLAAQGFFRNGKLGILYDDNPKWKNVEQNVLEPELRRFHVNVVDRAAYKIEGFGDVAGAQPALRSYVAHFQTTGVDRVISFEPWEGWAFFMKEADSQKFYPKWGLSSQTDWSVAYGTGLAPDSEMPGAHFVGWSPVMDVWTSTSRPRWPRLGLCDGIYAAKGVTRDGPLAEVVSLALCDGLLDLADLGATVHGTLDRTNFREAVDGLAWESAFFPTMSVSMSHPDGVTVVRAAQWDEKAAQWSYTGGPTAVSS